jgi:hypothetical protein
MARHGFDDDGWQRNRLIALHSQPRFCRQGRHMRVAFRAVVQQGGHDRLGSMLSKNVVFWLARQSCD